MFSSGLPKSARKRVELAVAVAQEKLLSDHVDHALDLIALVDDDVNFTDAVEIYTRLMRLDEDDAQNVRTRALATLGKQAGQRGDWLSEPQPAPDAEESGGRSWFRQITHRMRGRENEQLRRRIELIAARTEVALIHTHVDNALHFVESLADEDELDDQKAVDLYLDALDVRESIAEVTYYFALAEIADDVLPAHGSGLVAARGEAVTAGAGERVSPEDGEPGSTDEREGATEAVGGDAGSPDGDTKD